MDRAELIGGALVGHPDPRSAARTLASLLVSDETDDAEAIRSGLDPELVRVLRIRLGGPGQQLEQACQEGAAWVLGRRSVALAHPWELVATLPSSAALPPGLRHTTGETMTHLIVGATMSIRVASPFIERVGLSYLADALAAATARGVELEVLIPDRSTHAAEALAELTRVLRREGDLTRFRTISLDVDAPWAHLKVVTRDRDAAYIGSANVTSAGIGGRNLELGILVRGPAVETVHALLDMFASA